MHKRKTPNKLLGLTPQKLRSLLDAHGRQDRVCETLGVTPRALIKWMEKHDDGQMFAADRRGQKLLPYLQNKPLTVRELTKAAATTRQNVHVNLKLLIGRGLVERIEGPPHRYRLKK